MILIPCLLARVENSKGMFSLARPKLSLLELLETVSLSLISSGKDLSGSIWITQADQSMRLHLPHLRPAWLCTYHPHRASLGWVSPCQGWWGGRHSTAASQHLCATASLGFLVYFADPVCPLGLMQYFPSFFLPLLASLKHERFCFYCLGIQPSTQLLFLEPREKTKCWEQQSVHTGTSMTERQFFQEKFMRLGFIRDDRDDHAHEEGHLGIQQSQDFITPCRSWISYSQITSQSCFLLTSARPVLWFKSCVFKEKLPFVTVFDPSQRSEHQFVSFSSPEDP